MRKKTFLCVLLFLVLICSMSFSVYAAEVSCQIDLEVKNRLTGDVPGAAETFTFVLEAEDDAPMPAEDSITIRGSGKGLFPAIEYTEPDDYHYILYEKKGSRKGSTYDPAVYHVTVQVTTEEDGLLKASVYMSKDGAEGKAITAEFVNHYEGTRDSDTKDPDGTPKTGDTTDLRLWITLSVVSFAGLLIILLAFRKKKQ